jgi:hypothetical protein
MRSLLILLMLFVFIGCASSSDVILVRQNEQLMIQNKVLEEQARTISTLEITILQSTQRIEDITRDFVGVLEEAADLSTMFMEIDTYVRTILQTNRELQEVISEN